MKVAVLQSNYIPWKGYFDIINRADIFIFYDDVQFTKKDWRTRNKIKTHGGLKWLSVPCLGSQHSLICEIKIDQSSNWQRKHWTTIVNSYGKAKYFNKYKHFFEELYLDKKWLWLSEFNQYTIMKISREILGINTEFKDSREFTLSNDKFKEDRWIPLLKQLNTREYILGPAAKNYLDEKTLINEGIKIHWMDYSGYSEYQQLYPPFEHHVSIIDLIFNVGADFLYYISNQNNAHNV